MKSQDLLKKLKGVHTVESIMSILSVDRNKAIYYVHRLRKKGYIKTKRLSDGRRVYSISSENRLGGISYYDILNKYTPVKVVPQETHLVYGKEPSLEETLVYAIKTRSLRTILSSLALFKKISNWKELYHLSKKNNIERQVGALYDLSRTLFRTRKMEKRFRTFSLPKKGQAFDYIIPRLKSDDFKSIEKKWRIYLPFNKSDLGDYR